MKIKCFVGYAKPPPFMGEQARWFSHLMEPVHAYVELASDAKAEGEHRRARYSVLECVLHPLDANLKSLFVDVDRIGYHCTNNVMATLEFVRQAMHSTQCVTADLQYPNTLELSEGMDVMVYWSDNHPPAYGVVTDANESIGAEEVACVVQGPV